MLQSMGSQRVGRDQTELNSLNGGIPSGSSGKERACKCGRLKETLAQSLGWEDSPGGGHGNSPIVLPGEPFGQRSLASYSPLRRTVRHDRNDLAHTHSLNFRNNQE